MLKNAYLVFTCKGRYRYSRKRATFCRNFADRPSCRRRLHAGRRSRRRRRCPRRRAGGSGRDGALAEAAAAARLVGLAPMF